MTEVEIEIRTWEDLRNEVKNIPIEEVALLRENKLGVRRRGNQLFGICPFHNDQNIGNFALGGPHNGYKCFSCGVSGDSIDLIMEIDNLGFQEALVTIARETELMNESDLDNFANEGKSASITRMDWSFGLSSDAYAEMTEEDRANRHIVYSLLSQGKSVINPVKDKFGGEKEERLNTKHYYHLKEERGLSDKQIEDAGFFSLEKEYNYVGPIYYRLINEYNLLPNTLNVPGFWRSDNNVTIQRLNKSDGTVIEFDEDDNQYFWKFDGIDALGIPIKDESGNIVAIQLRPDYQGPNASKYVWFSSANARNRNGKLDGLSPGAQIDVMYPDNWNTPHLFITEGKFKSIAINQHLRSASISLQGINTYSGIGEIINNIDANHSKDIENIFIMFDGDMSFNDSVINAVINMADSELDGYNIYIGVWDYLFGKGFDDLVNNGHADALARISIEQLKVIAKKVIAVNDKNLSAEDNKNEKEKIFYSWMKEHDSSFKLHSSRNL